MCHALFNVFSPTLNTYDLKERRKSHILRMYKSIIQARDYKDSGMFGSIYEEKNQDRRKLSLEIFETVVIDEQLYKGL